MMAWIPVYFALIVLAMLALLVAALLTPLFLHSRDRARLYDFLRRCHEEGRPLPAELISQIIAGPVPTAEKDLRRGVLLLAVAFGLAIPLLSAGHASLHSGLWVGPLLAVSVSGCLGASFLLLGVLRRPAKS